MKSLKRGVFGVGAVALGFATFGWSPNAHAAGFATQRFGGEQGSVLSTNPTAVYYNPGAMGFSGNGQLGVYGSLALRNVSWSHTATPAPPGAPNDANLGNSGEAHAFNVFGGPAIGGTMRFGNLVIGGGFFAPFYGRMHWDKNNNLNLTAAQKANYPYVSEGVQRWFGVDAELSVLYFAAGAAYRLGPLSIGASGNVIYSRIVTTSSKDLNYTPPTTTNESREDLYVDGWNGSFAAGAMLEIVPNQFWLAGGYQSQPGMGEQVLSGNLITTNKTGVTNQNVEFHEYLPDVYRAGVRYKPKNTAFEFRLFGDYTRWSVMTTQCLALKGQACVVQANGANLPGPTAAVLANFIRNWDDSWGLRGGVSYWVKPNIETFLGVGYETAAIPDATLTPDIADANNVAGTLGTRIQISDFLYMTLSWTHIQFFDRDNTGKSTTAVANGQPVQVPTANEDGGGVYKQWVGVFTGNLEALF